MIVFTVLSTCMISSGTWNTCGVFLLLLGRRALLLHEPPIFLFILSELEARHLAVKEKGFPLFSVCNVQLTTLEKS